MEGKAGKGAKRARAARAVRAGRPGQKGRSKAPYAVAAAVLVIAVFAYLFYGLLAPTSFPAFKSSFNSAGSVAIYVNDTNSSTYTYALACADSLIQELTGPTAVHRDASTIHFFVLYNASTACVYNPGVLGQVAANYTYTSASYCLNYSSAMPSIFLKYSAANSTIVEQNRLYVSGNAKFMALCGIAYQIRVT